MGCTVRDAAVIRNTKGLTMAKTDPGIEGLKRLYEALRKRTCDRWISGKPREDGTAQVYSPNLGRMLRQIVPVAETEADAAELIAAMYNALPALVDAYEERETLREALTKQPILAFAPCDECPIAQK